MVPSLSILKPFWRRRLPYAMLRFSVIWRYCIIWSWHSMSAHSI